MVKVQNFYSSREKKKPEEKRRYHNHRECPSGQEIRPTERRPGTGGYRLCEHCASL